MADGYVYYVVTNVRNLKTNEFALLCALCGFADLKKDGSCWPSQTTLCKATGLSVRSLRRAQGVLIERGLIAIAPGDGRGNTTVYTLLFHDAVKGATLAAFRPESNGKKAARMTLKAATLADRTYIEPTRYTGETSDADLRMEAENRRQAFPIHLTSKQPPPTSAGDANEAKPRKVFGGYMCCRCGAALVPAPEILCLACRQGWTTPERKP